MLINILKAINRFIKIKIMKKEDNMHRTFSIIIIITIKFLNKIITINILKMITANLLNFNLVLIQIWLIQMLSFKFFSNCK